MPSGFKVVASGLEKSERVGADKIAYTLPVHQALVPGQHRGGRRRSGARRIRKASRRRFISAQKQSMANAYGEETGKVMTYSHQRVRLAAASQSDADRNRRRHSQRILGARADLPFAQRIGDQVAVRLLANQVARQWWGDAGFAHQPQSHVARKRHGALCGDAVAEHAERPGALEQAVHDTYVEALTVDNPPLIQAGAAGRLFAGILGRHRRQGRGGAEHAAQRHGRRQVLRSC